MKRSGHKNKKGEKPVITCAWCGHNSPSKYDSKNHVCRQLATEARRFG